MRGEGGAESPVHSMGVKIMTFLYDNPTFYPLGHSSRMLPKNRA